MVERYLVEVAAPRPLVLLKPVPTVAVGEFAYSTLSFANFIGKKFVRQLSFEKNHGLLNQRKWSP